MKAEDLNIFFPSARSGEIEFYSTLYIFAKFTITQTYMKEVVIGIDIGGTNTKFGLVTETGDLYEERSIPTGKQDDIEDFITELYDAVKLILGNGSFNARGIGIGAPNANYYNGTMEGAGNLTWDGVVPLVSLFEKHFRLPGIVTNDANAAAIGELLYGKGKGLKHFLMITLGTGLGSGFVVDGKVVYGYNGLAGELGHTVSVPEGRQCTCSKKGCLEAYVSAPGIVKTVFELLASEIEDTDLRNYSFNDLDAKMITDAAIKGDPIALKAFDYKGKLLGLNLAEAVLHTAPETIFLFGGLSRAGNLIFDPAKKYMEENLLPVFRDSVKILPSGLQEKNIAVLGAGALMWNELTNKS